jgi:hypothetical protein
MARGDPAIPWSMRPSLLLALFTFAAGCGGAAAATDPGAKVPAGDSEQTDPGFIDYAASHGIQTLNGGGGDAPEVTADGLRLESVDKDKPIKLDGVPTEWPPFAKATLVLRGASKSQMVVGLQYDDSKLYVAAEIKDASFAVGRDHVSLVLAVPTPSSVYETYDLSIFAGKPGESEGSVRFGGHGVVPGAKVVEAPDAGGYTLEAAIPWGSLPAARTTRVGIHGVAGYVDGDSEIATGPLDPQHPASMAWIPSEPELSMIEQFLAPRGLTKTAPSFDAVADLTGDGIRERIAVFDHFLTICGSAYLGGTGFFYRDLGGDLVRLDVRDATGRGKGDVVVRRRAAVGGSTREYLEVLSAMSNTDEPRVTFTHEIEVRQSDKHIDNAVRLARGEIDVTVEPSTTWDALSYQEPIASDAAPILFPWGGVRSETWRWDGTRFKKAGEVAQKEAVPGGGTVDHPPPHPAEPPTPKVARGGSLSEAMLDQYRKDRGAGDAAPKSDLRVQVAGDARPERVVLVGRDIVVFGPGFKGGTGYSFVTLAQFADAADVTELSARDLTGDGAADLIVRGVRHVGADGGSVDSEVLFVYQVNGDAITRVFGIETARERANKRVQGLVQFIPAPGNKKFDVLSAPGRATGWTEKTYPWAQDQPGSGDIEPLILPWGGIHDVRYRWNGSGFAKLGD